jgi:4-oxalocrotonate tautomerase
MPEVTIKIVEGRTLEQKRGLVKDITEAVVKNIGGSADAVTIDIIEYPLANKAKGGKLFVDREKP